VPKLEHGARHVEVGGDDDQRLKAARLHPPPRLDRVADGVGGGTIDIDAAGKPALVLRHQPRDFTRTRERIDAADQKALAAAGGKEIESIVDAERPAGQRHDAVSIPRGGNLGHRHPVNEHKKIRTEQRHGETQHHPQGTPPATAGRRRRGPGLGVFRLWS
jgi:hypothetical protein